MGDSKGRVTTSAAVSLAEFLESCAGKWFSQRTSYRLGASENWHQSDKTTLFVDFLAPDALELQALTASQGTAIAGLQSRWEATPLQTASTSLLVLFAEGDRLIHQRGDRLWQGRYHFAGNHRGLTLQTEQPEGAVEERFWFAHPNLRLRTSLIRDRDGLSRSSFYSEIRLGVKPPEPPAEA
ncbi:phycobiliprotein lyase [Synechococcus elongatus IITB5]|uniref:phycobiliprotein lyase n=1 Tax=Synechococcus elongatus TaxID=32046 RepID=UPI0030CD000F